MTPDEVSSWKKKYEKESFPGLEVSLEDITSMMTAPDPGAAVGAKAISAAGSDFNYLDNLSSLIFYSQLLGLSPNSEVGVPEAG